jgi:hypothetical protein
MNSRSSDAIWPGAQALGGPSAAARQLLDVVFFVTVLTSSFVFIEPAPHDVLMFVLLVACIVARVPIDRKLVPLLIMISVWLTGCLVSLVQIGDNPKAIQYTGTSIYLGIAALLFACLFSDGDMRRLSILRRAYILAALMATAAGAVGFFHLLPGSSIFLDNGRLSGTFKDPNVYGPFLVFPLLLLMLSQLRRGVTVIGMIMTAVLLSGLLLGFSRGAWIHFALSSGIAVVLAYLTATDWRQRARIGVVVLAAIVAIGALVVALTSIESIHAMFLERAKTFQSYDLGPGGRFSLQQIAVDAILDNPDGMGPFAFSDRFGGQQHNVYMQCFLVYGWVGGAAYLTLVVTTLVLGLRFVLFLAPWREYFIAAYAAFAGEAFEGLFIDSDHWRHFFLLLGLIWGLSAATINARWRQSHSAESRSVSLAIAGT